MTLEQREKLYRILGKIEGLTWGVDNSCVAEGCVEVSEELANLLEEDAQQSEATGEAFIDRILKENKSND